MDATESCGVPTAVARSDVSLKQESKLQSLQCPLKSRSNAERHKLEEDLNSLSKIVREKEASLKERMNDSDANQTRLKEIRQDKDATINQRKSIDDDLKALNDEKNRETFIKLRGTLQYRTEEALIEAIRRLELQLATHNYRVLEEKKIVQEIDRMKRSKKALNEYLALEQEQERMKNKQRMMRNQRDTLYRRVTSLKNDEEDVKRTNMENRTLIDQLKKDLDGLHVQRRKLLNDLQQATQPLLHLQDLQQKRPQNLRRRENCLAYQQHSPKEDVKCLQERSACRKERGDGKYLGDVLREKEMLCNTLITYLQRLTVSPVITPSTPIGEEASPTGTPVSEIQQGDMLLVLWKKGNDCDAASQKSCRVGKKGKRDRKRVQQNRLLSHTPDMLGQFYKLEISPPSTINDTPLCLEALAAKKQQLIYMRENFPSKMEQSPTCKSAIVECFHKNISKEETFCQSVVNASQDRVSIEVMMEEKCTSDHSGDVTTVCGQTTSIWKNENLNSAELICACSTDDVQLSDQSCLTRTSISYDTIPVLPKDLSCCCEDTLITNGNLDPKCNDQNGGLTLEAPAGNLRATNELYCPLQTQVCCDASLCDKYILINSNGDERGCCEAEVQNCAFVSQEEDETVHKIPQPVKSLSNDELNGVLNVDCPPLHLCKSTIGY